jgi:hypothetical protein
VIEFPRQPPLTVEGLWAAVQRMVFALRSGAESFVITGQSITSAISPVGHGLKGRAPTLALFVPSNGTEILTEVQAADDRFVYFQASGDLSGKVVIWP